LSIGDITFHLVSADRRLAPFHGAAGVDHTATALERIVSKTPCYRLGFVPDASVIKTLKPYLSGSGAFISR